MNRRDFFRLAPAAVPASAIARLPVYRAAPHFAGIDLAYGPDQVAYIEWRKFAQSEICRIYSIPPHLIGSSASASA